MIEAVRLRNFRQHKETLIKLVPGINTFVGDNGSGKSTIPEAIEFALYGAKALRDDAKSFIRDGEDNGSAVVVLSMGEDTYTVGRNTKDAEVRRNGELDAKYKNNVSAYINRLTGVNHTGFRLGHYVRQKELAAFSQLRPGKRHETVEKMLKSEIDTKQISFDAMTKKYQDVDALDNELMDVGIVLESTKLESATVLTDLEHLLAVLTTLRADKAAYDLAFLNKGNLSTAIAEAKKALQTAVAAKLELEPILAQITAAAQVSDEAYKALKAKVEELRTLERQSSRMLEVKRELDLPEPVAPVVIAEPKPPLREHLTQATVALTTAKKLRDSVKTLQPGVECPTCHQGISHEHASKVLACAEEMVTSASASVTEATTALNEATTAYTAAQAQYRAYLTARASYDAAHSRRRKLLAEYVETAFDASEQKKVEHELEQAHTARERWLVLDGERKRLEGPASKEEELQAKVDELLSQHEAIQLTPVDTEYIKELETTERQLNDRSRFLASQMAHAEGRVLELQRQVTAMTEMRTAIATASGELAMLRAQVDLFVLFKRHLTAKIRPLLQEVAESLFHRTTKNRYASYQLGSDYEITLTTHKGFIRKLVTISGSENDLACLCLRLAIATLRSTRLSGSLGFVILDEISGAFDDERTKQTLEGLLELREVIPQIINITHKPVEMKFADKLFTVKESNGIATVS